MVTFDVLPGSKKQHWHIELVRVRRDHYVPSIVVRKINHVHPVNQPRALGCRKLCLCDGRDTGGDAEVARKQAGVVKRKGSARPLRMA